MRPIYRWMLSAVLFGSGTLTGLALAQNPAKPTPTDPSAKVTFDNSRVTVKEITLSPGAPRPSRTRDTDELVLFFAESRYEAITPQGKKEPRAPPAGDRGLAPQG